MCRVYPETATVAAIGSGGAAAMALRAAWSGIEIQDHTHTRLLVVRIIIDGLDFIG